ncbi:hypothetical protein J6Z19_04450 [bacterium]|nr:hypothetical protein [bacterium]
MDFSFSDDLLKKIIKVKQTHKKNQDKIDILHRRVFQEFWEKQLNKRNLFSIAIPNEILDSIQFSVFTEKLKVVESEIRENNFIKINASCDILEKKYLLGNTFGVRKQLESESYDNVVFFFGEEGVTLYIDGEAIEDNNFFYSHEDRMRYLKKRDISQLEIVLDEYAKQYLTQQVNYMCILADNATLRQIDSSLINRNILKNKPEHYMRDQLCQYLTEHMQYTFNVEVELGQSKKRNDIYFDVRGELYFIEIKWIGVSINDSGTGISTPYGVKRVKEGVTQTLEYIKELLNTSEKSLRTGYLLVYDARDEKKDINLENYDFVGADLKVFMQNFKYLKPIPITKTHAA